MAVTAQELNAAAQRLLSAYATVTPKIDEALSLIQSLDPCSAGAKAALDKSKVVRDQGASIFNGEVKEALRAYNALYAQAEGEVKELGKSLNQQINGTQDPLVAKNGIVKEFQASFAEKIAKCPAATPPTTANNTPTTATAATANAAPTANTASGTNITGEADGDKKTGGNTTAPAPATVPTEKKSEDEKPGKRLFNPLGEFPTYTYNLSLYMITPKAYDAFTASGRTKLPTEGLAVVCQSGGVNNDVQMRGAGFTMDYYIDNLKIETFTSGMDTQTSTNTTNIEFQINEPYGFSFISNLQRCANDLIAKSKEQGLENLDNSTRQFFILGIRFTGFDVDGTPIKDKKTGMPLYERFYDIYISEMKFKLDNKATVYSIKAVSAAPGVAFGAKRGIWNTGGTLRGTTVYDMLKNMEDQLNKTAADSVKNTKIKPNTYKFKIVGEKIGDDEASQRAAPIFRERMISETDVTKQTLVGSKPNVTNGRAGQDQGLPDTTVGELAIANGTPILQAFESIISRSTYITSAFKTIQNNPLESNPQKANGEIEQTADNKNYVRWYNVSASVQNGQFFKEINDFTYDITYVFQVYETPVITNPYSNPGVPYYGPVKRYDYWFTGQNSEILGYTQNLDNTFFTVAVGGLNENQNTTTTPATPVATGAIPNAPKTDTTNVQDAGKRAYITSLFDPSSQANVSIKIMGDPDFLMPESTVPINKLYNRFYGTQDLTINPNGGQVFIEIDFKEPQDYDFRSTDGITYSSTGTGVMSVNDKIQFWNYPKKVANMVKGVSYRLIKVSSKFDKGVFEQDLQCVINTFPDVQDDTIDDLQEVTVSSQKKPVPGSSNVTGLKPDKLPTPGKGITSPSIDFLKQSKAAVQSANDDKNKFELPNVTKTLNEKARFDPGAVPAIPGLTSGPPRGFGGGG